MDQINIYKSEFEKLGKTFTNQVFHPEHSSTLVPETMVDMPESAENGEPNPTTFIALSESSIIRGGLVGAILTAAIGFNAGKYSRLGAVRKRARFLRRFVSNLNKPECITFTNYFYPNLKTVTKNFMCFSGESGIGKSYHFENMAYMESLVRPALYLSFKASGKGSTFEEDMSIKLNYGEGENPPMLSEIMLAVRKINEINNEPVKFWLNVFAIHLGFIWSANGIIESHLLDANEGLFLGMLFTAYSYYIYIIYPALVQSFRRSKPLIIFDDVNKIDDIGKLAEISRYLELLDKNMANIILVSSDEETWFKLRKEPGLKDRLRQRLITYNSDFTAQQLLLYLNNETNYKEFLKKFRVCPLYSKEIILELVKELIGARQVTMRRFTSILVLNDEEEYEGFVKVLVACREGRMTTEEAVVKFTDILYDSEMETICAKLKHIKREISISDKEFITEMKQLLEKGKLPSDNKIAPSLMAYNIVRDCRSEYVFNGKFMYTVFQMAYEEYIRDLREYHWEGVDLVDVGQCEYDPRVASREEQDKKHQRGNFDETLELLKKAEAYTGK